MKVSVFFYLVFATFTANGQSKPQSFFEKDIKDYSVCPGKTANALSESQVENMIAGMLDKIGIRNSYIIIDCPQVENCQATVWTDGKPYILYNPVFLDKVKRLNFSQDKLPELATADWETLTLLAHELGHLVHNHFTNPKPRTTAWDWELEADQFAGFLIYKMKGKLSDALSVYNSQFISEKGTYTHPGRSERKKSVEFGWMDAKRKDPDIAISEMNNKERYDFLILTGDRLYENNNYNEAIKEYNKAIALDPQKAQAYHDRGWSYYYKKDYTAAIADFDKALQIDPNFYGAYTGRARAKAKSGNNVGALADYNKVVNLAREAKYYYNRAGFKKEYQKDYQGALDDYDHAILLDKNNKNYYYDRATLKIVYFKSDPTACIDLKKAADLGSASAKDMYKDLCDDRLKKSGYRIQKIEEVKKRDQND